MTSSNSKQRAYLSLLLRPENITEDDLAFALDEVLTTDLFTIRQQCKQAPPCIIASLPMAEAQTALQLLRHLGCTAFAPSLDDLLALGPSIQIKSIRLDANGILLESWREGTQIIQPQDIDVIINAKIKDQIKKPALNDESTTHFLSKPIVNQALTGMAEEWYSARVEQRPAEILREFDYVPKAAPAQRTSPKCVCKLDLHTTSGSDHTVFHVNADKFSFDILGQEKGLADSVNIDKLTELFAALATNAAIDPFFEFFKPPPDHHQLRIPKRGINNDHPVFAFYSRWAALMYRYLAT